MNQERFTVQHSTVQYSQPLHSRYIPRLALSWDWMLSGALSICSFRTSVASASVTSKSDGTPLVQTHLEHNGQQPQAPAPAHFNYMSHFWLT